MIKNPKDSKAQDKIKSGKISREKIRRIDPACPQLEFIHEAANVIKKGGIILFPTKYLYGIGADAFNGEAVNRIFEIKQRPYHKPILVLINHRKQLNDLVRYIPPVAYCMMEKFWPGDLTIVLDAKEMLPMPLTAGTGKIGVRLTGYKVAFDLVSELQGPMTGTSANLSGAPGCSRVSDLDPLIADQLDLILDAGPLRGGIGSTVIDVTADSPKILREGGVPAKDIYDLLKKH